MAEPQESTHTIDMAIIALAQKFEQALAAGEQPHAETFLKQATGSSRGFLLLELLRIQLEHDWKRGAPKAWNNYLAAWPELANCVGAEVAFQSWNNQHEELAKKKSDWPQHERYEFLQKLGYGTFGSVYKAWDRYKKQHVAVKVSKAGSVAKKTFEDERRAIEKLKHKHIVRLIDSHCPTEPNADRLLVYELMEGGTLKDRLKSGPLAPEVAVEFAIKIADALQHAHDNDLIHRDLKPANILFDRNGNLCVGDFGLAVTDAELLQQSDVDAGAGTHLYMSPEQLRKERPTITLQTDIYSLGVILYEMLCGKRPFEYSKREEFEKFKELVVHRKPEHVWKRGVQRPANEEVADELWEICFKALAKSPDSRFSGAKAMANRLRALKLETLSSESKSGVVTSDLKDSKRINDPFSDLSQPEFENLQQSKSSAEQSEKPISSDAVGPNAESTTQPDTHDQMFPPDNDKSIPSRFRTVIGLVVSLCLAALAGFWLLQIPPISKTALADELNFKQIGVCIATSESVGNRRLAWPITERDGRKWFVAHSELSRSAQLLDENLLPVQWNEFKFAESEPDWIKLPLLSPLWRLDRCGPSVMDEGSQLVLLNQEVFNRSPDQPLSASCFSEIRVFGRTDRDGSVLLEIDQDVSEIAIGSPVFAVTSETRLVRYWDEYVRHRTPKTEMRLAGFVVSFDKTPSSHKSLIVSPINELESEIAHWSLPNATGIETPQLITSDPARGTNLPVRQMTVVRLTFNLTIKVESLRKLVTNNGQARVHEPSGTNSRSVEIEVTPESLGDVTIQFPRGFFTSAENVESREFKLDFKAIDRNPPKFVEMKWLSSNDKKSWPFEVIFSKPVKPKEGTVQDWFLIYDGTAADGATVVLDEPWKESCHQLRATMHVKQEGALILKFRSEFFVDDSGLSIAPGDDPDIDVDQRKLRGVFDWTGPKVEVVLSQRIVQPNGSVSVRVVTKPEEQVRFNPSQIQVRKADSSPVQTTELATSVKFNLQATGSDDIQITILKGLAEDVSQNSSLEEFSFSIPVRAMPSTQDAESHIQRAKQVFGRLNPNDRNPADLVAAEKLLADLDKVPISATPNSKPSDESKAVWEWNCLRGAVALELAKYFYALTDGRDKFRTHIETATSKLDQSRLAVPNTARGKALVGMLAARSRIDRASDKQVTATGAISATGRMNALGWLNEAESILGQIQNDVAILGPNRRDFIGYYDYLVARRNAISNWVEHNYQDAYLPPSMNPAGKPDIWSELEKSFAEIWEPEVVTINKGKQHD